MGADTGALDAAGAGVDASWVGGVAEADVEASYSHAGASAGTRLHRANAVAAAVFFIAASCRNGVESGNLRVSEAIVNGRPAVSRWQGGRPVAQVRVPACATRRETLVLTPRRCAS
jgi:hypothetical protein